MPQMLGSGWFLVYSTCTWALWKWRDHPGFWKTMIWSWKTIEKINGTAQAKACWPSRRMYPHLFKGRSVKFRYLERIACQNSSKRTNICEQKEMVQEFAKKHLKITSKESSSLWGRTHCTTLLDQSTNRLKWFASRDPRKWFELEVLVFTQH